MNLRVNESGTQISPACNQSADRFVRHSKLGAERSCQFASSPTLTDLLRLLECELARPSVPVRVSPAPLLSRVLNVVLRRTEKQMLRVDALRIVALMANVSSFRNRANESRVNKSTGQLWPPTPTEFRIPHAVSGSTPIPTARLFFNDISHEAELSRTRAKIK